MWMTLNYLKTNSTKLAHYRLKVQKVIEFFDFQSSVQHPLCKSLISINSQTEPNKYEQTLYAISEQLCFIVYIATSFTLFNLQAGASHGNQWNKHSEITLSTVKTRE